MDAQGISYTESEYDYAIQQGEPVMGFVHAHPEDISAKKTERDPVAADKLDAFRSKVQQRMCKSWANADELGGVVSRSYVQILKTHPGEGWAKYRYAKTTEDLEKMNRMHEQIRVLEQEIARLRELDRQAPLNLASGADAVRLKYGVDRDGDKVVVGTVETTWNEVFGVVGRTCMNLPSESRVRGAIGRWFSGLANRTVSIAK